MSKLYFEMNDKEKQLNHIGENLDYATCMFGEGLSGAGRYNMSSEKVREIQNRITDHLMAARGDINLLLKSTEEFEDNLEEEELEEECGLDLHPVEKVRDLSVLNNYQVEYFMESEDEEGRKGVSILLKRTNTGGCDKYRQLLFSGNGNQYMSDEF